MKSPPPVSRILFDCTTTQSNTLRGIPRVIRSVMRHASEVAGERGGTVIPLTYAFGGWSEASLTESDESARKHLVNSLATSWVEQFCRMVPSRKLRRLVLPPPGRDGIWKFPRKFLATSQRLNHRLTHQSVSPRAGDVLMLFNSWLRAPASFWRNVKEARRRGACIGTVVYDLIPITHPYFVGPNHEKKFRSWLRRIAEHSDFFVAISETVKAELQGHLKNSDPKQDWSDDRFFSFMLGSEIPAPSGALIRDSVEIAFEAGNTYLMVGALEPRKNQAFLLDAFDRLWQRGSHVKLCFVGSETRAVPELRDRLNNHRERNSRLYYFSDLNDDELDYCYQHTRALVCPSLVEGFGLPIIEALQYGKCVFASNTRIHHEVGRDYCEYFDLGCSESLAARIAEFESQLHEGNIRPKIDFKAPTWNESCREMLEICFHSQTIFVPDRQEAARAA